MPTIAAFPVSKTEPVDINGLSNTSKSESTSSIKTGFLKAEPAISPLNIDISSLLNSDSVEIATPSFLKITGGQKINSDEINSTHVLEDPSIDLKVEPEPFLTILVNSPPQISADAPQLQSSSVAIPNSAYIPHSYPLVSAPTAPPPYPIAITPLPLLPLEPAIPSTEQVVISPSAEAFNDSALTTENLQMSANLTVFPLSPAKPVKIEFNSYAGHGALYQALPSFYGIIYPVPHSILPYPFGQHIELEKPKNKPATSYGPPRSTYVQYENDNYQRPFGHPPTARALGFPPISNTHDNLRREVNWYRVGRSYRSADLA